MVTLRCTRKLLGRFRGLAEPSPTPPTTRLGNWHANLILRPGGHLVLCVSERTLLPVVIPAREMVTLAPRFRRAVGDLLRALAVPDREVEEEEHAMSDVLFGPTTSRQVLGSMNDFAEAIRFAGRRSESLLDLALWLAETPCGPLKMDSPWRATVSLFAPERC